MEKIIIIVLTFFLCAVLCKPLVNSEIHAGGVYGIMQEMQGVHKHNLRKRFINPGSFGGFVDHGFTKMRTKRSYDEECEKLQLCRMHARSSNNFFAAFQLYFVNKENARQWDHHTHSLADCHRRFSCY